MSFVFKENNDQNLIVKKNRGNIFLIEIQEILIKTMQLNALFRQHNILNDYRYSLFDFSAKELIDIKGIKLKELPKTSFCF
ncbi:MAG: hypothetical protein COB81_11090 [Flavobacteriaceae bacterium]|nr:MAG: hypothetical protein COB81_11090 [Flavobacteriaceae bacterium]